MDMEDGDREEGLSGQQEQKTEKVNLPTLGDHEPKGIFLLFIYVPSASVCTQYHLLVIALPSIMDYMHIHVPNLNGHICLY